MKPVFQFIFSLLWFFGTTGFGLATVEETYAMAGVGNRTVSLEYDRIHRLIAEVIVPVESGPLQSTTYGYDAAHNRISKQVTGEKPGNAVSTYNQLNQLTHFTDAVAGLSATFAYDLNGNRTRLFDVVTAVTFLRELK